MFFSGPKVLLLLKRNTLEIYYKSSDKVFSVDFEDTAIRHLEIINPDEVIKTLSDSLKSINLLKQNAVLVLSGSIVFQRLIRQKEPDITQKEIKKFFHEVPLEEEHIGKKIIPIKNALLCLAANRELYQLVIETTLEFDWKIKAVVPMNSFAKIPEETQLTPEQVSQILSADQVFKESDFLSESNLEKDEVLSEASDSESPETKPESRVKTVVTLLIGLFLISLIAGSLFYFKVIQLPFKLPWMNSDPVTSLAVPIATNSAQVAPVESSASANTQEASVSGQINRDDVRIHVLNGSGIAGQANIIKEKLAEIGYENVITGNIEGSEASGSGIVYSQGLEEIIKGEVNGLMDALVNGITKVDEAINEFNAVITLGKLDKAIE